MQETKRFDPVFVVFGPFTKREEYDEFAKYDDAVDYASRVSKHLPGIQIEVHLLRSDCETGELLAACQAGRLLQNVQVEFLDVPKKTEQKFQSGVGKAWWRLLEQFTEGIRGYHYRLTPLTDGERFDLQVKQRFQDQVLNHLREEMTELEFASARWKFVDSVMYKNRVAPLPELLKNYSDSTIRKFYGQAFRKTGGVAIRERWILNGKAQELVKQFVGAPKSPDKLEVVPPELSALSGRGRSSKSKKAETSLASNPHEQVSLFA